MKEADQNTKIKNAIQDLGGWAYKIPDPPKGSMGTIARPFDLFGVLYDKSIYIETKVMNKLEAFNFGKLQAHQYTSLCRIDALATQASCFLLLCVKVSNRIQYASVPINYLTTLIDQNAKSIPKQYILDHLSTLEEALYRGVNYVK